MENGGFYLSWTFTTEPTTITKLVFKTSTLLLSFRRKVRRKKSKSY